MFVNLLEGNIKTTKTLCYSIVDHDTLFKIIVGLERKAV